MQINHRPKMKLLMFAEVTEPARPTGCRKSLETYAGLSIYERII